MDISIQIIYYLRSEEIFMVIELTTAFENRKNSILEIVKKRSLSYAARWKR